MSGRYGRSSNSEAGRSGIEDAQLDHRPAFAPGPGAPDRAHRPHRPGPGGNGLLTARLQRAGTLFFDLGARLIGSGNLEHYQQFVPPAGSPEARFPARWHRALILGDGLEGVSIAGQGVIDGNNVYDAQGEEHMRGPHTVLLGNCRKVTIRDVHFRDSANYAVLLELCDEVEVREVKITGGWDGVHFRGTPERPCRNVTITGCRLYTGDDAIAGRYWEDVLISGCILNSSCNAVRLIGPARRLTINDCLVSGPGVHQHRSSGRHNMLAGFNLQPGSWDATEGVLDEVLISDITLHNVLTPFHICLRRGNRAGSITVTRVTVTGAYRAAASVESWSEAPFERVVFRDVDLEFQGGGSLEDARQEVHPPGVDARPLPAWGFYARRVKDLRLEDVRLSCVRDDQRPALIAEEVEGLSLDGFRFDRFKGTEALLLGEVGELRVRDAGFALLEPGYAKLEARPGDAAGRFIAGKPFSVAVALENGAQEGLGRVELEAAGRKRTRWIWLGARERKEVLFRRIEVAEPGEHELRAGPLSRRVRIEP